MEGGGANIYFDYALQSADTLPYQILSRDVSLVRVSQQLTYLLDFLFGVGFLVQARGMG